MNCTAPHISRCGIFFLIMLALSCTKLLALNSQPASFLAQFPSAEISGVEESSESVVINGETYNIQPPWKGNQFTAPEFDYNDFRRIPLQYTHNRSKIYLLATAYQPLVDLLEAAEKDGIFLKVESAYRSERYQKHIFKRMIAEGRTFEDIVRYVAPPGYSQHMLGTAVDFFPSNWRFADTTAYIWLQENGWLFGFEETYSQFNPMRIPWESWHWNFIGKNNGKQTGAERPPFDSTKKSGSHSSTTEED